MSTSIEDELALELKLKASGIEVFRDERNLFSDLPDGSQLPAYPSTAQMIKKLSAFYPKLWAQLHPRTYTGGNGHCPATIPAVSLMYYWDGMCLFLERFKGDVDKANAGLVEELKKETDDARHLARCLAFNRLAAALIKNRVPTFHVGADLLRAATLTDVPPDFTWQDAKLPFDAGLFLLPSGVFSVAGASLSWLSWLRVRAGVPIQAQGNWGCDFTPNADAMYVYAGTLDSVFRKAHAFKLEGDSLTPELRKRSTPLTPEQQNVVASYKAAGLAVATVVFNLLSAMNLRPELVERTGRRVRTIKNGPAKEEWTPNWVGRTYRFPKADGGGTHASPRLHWRRGHYRRQAHGTGRKQHKIMWIEPHMVGATDQAGGAA